MIAKEKWIWFTQNLGLEHTALSSHAKFSQSTAVGKFVINTIGEISSSLDGKPTEYFGAGLHYQSIIFSLNHPPRGPWDADYVKGIILTKKYSTKREALDGHLNLCEIYAKRSSMRGIK
jgi:hypothetical protein